MNKYKQAYHIATTIIGYTPEEISEAQTLLLELVEKAVPNKTIKWDCSLPETRCPKCGAGLERKHDYCWSCGQKIDWED